MSIIILSLSIINSLLVIQLLFNEWRFLTKIAVAITVAIIILGPLLYIFYAVYPALFETPIFTIALELLVFIILKFNPKTKFVKTDFNISIAELILIIALVFFSSWLMFGSLSYSFERGTINIGSHLWSDFGSHIPLIRSFFLGQNYPPEFPLFANENIRYHFMFYFLAAIFEKFGDDLTFGLNLISTLTFFSLGILIFELGRSISGGKTSVGIIAVLLSFLNSSFTFITVFKKDSFLDLNTYKIIWDRNTPFANGPYQDDIITTFWGLNIYLNQRHLALAFATLLVISLVLHRTFIKKEKPKLQHFILVGILVCLLPYWHIQAFVMAVVIIVFSSFIFLNKTIIIPIITTFVTLSIFSIPQLFLLLNHSPSKEPSFIFKPGYLITPPITLFKSLFWWFQNIGFTLLLIVEALKIQNKSLILFYFCFLPIFFVGFLFQFSPDIATNHKFFNFWLIITNLFVAVLLVKIFSQKYFGKIIAMLLFVLLTLSGVLELMPIKNDYKIEITDWHKNSISSWVEKNIPKDSTFLTSTSLYHPVSLAGRKIFLGWPYFAWSAGLNTTSRGEIAKLIYLGTDKNAVCNLLLKYKIHYLVIEEGREQTDYWQNKQFFDNYFKKLQQDKISNIIYHIYDTVQSCTTYVQE